MMNLNSVTKTKWISILTLVALSALVLGMVMVIALSHPDTLHGQEDATYTPISPGFGSEDTTTLPIYLNYIIQIAIGLAGIFAVAAIVFGGFQYVTTDSAQQKSSGKETIRRALFGLLLALGAYILLYTISPNIVNFPGFYQINFVGNEAGIEGSNSGGNGGGEWSFQDPDSGTTTFYETSAECEAAAPGTVVCEYSNDELSAEDVELFNEIYREEQRRRTELAENGIEINNAACGNVGATGCTNVGGLSDELVAALIAANGEICASGTCLTITGGTEWWLHSEGTLHKTGNAVDLRDSFGLRNYLGIDNPQPGDSVTINGVTYTYEGAGTDGSTGDHWHAVYNG